MSRTALGLGLLALVTWGGFGWTAAPAPPAAAEQSSGQDAGAAPPGDSESAEDSEGAPASEDAEDQTEPLEDIETILTQPLGQEEYVEAERCLSRYQFDSVDIIDNEHVLFEGRRGKAWLNTLRRPCIGLRRHDIPQFEYRASSQLCNLDDFVGIDRGFSSFSRTSASCVLGDFQPVTVEQVALIKATVESRKKRNRARKKKDPGES